MPGGPARGGAPPGGHRRDCSPLDPPGARDFEAFSNFSTLCSTTSHRGLCQAALPGMERLQAATGGTPAPWAPPGSLHSDTSFCSITTTTTTTTTSHRGLYQAALPGEERLQAATGGTPAPWAPPGAQHSDTSLCSTTGPRGLYQAALPGAERPLPGRLGRLDHPSPPGVDQDPAHRGVLGTRT